jgi:Bax protein
VKNQVVFYLLFSLVTATVLTSCTDNDYPYEVRVIKVHLDSLAQVIPVNDSLVTPVLYDTLWINNLLTITEKKQQFINQILPAILIVRFKEQLKYEKIEILLSKLKEKKSLAKKEIQFLDSMKLKYEASTYENLPERIKLHPISLVLAQAAIESGWGQSRFVNKGNNLFGIVDGNRESRLFTKGIRKVHMKQYETIEESIENYFLTIGRSKVYSKFRIKRFEEANVYQMIDELHKYSVKGKEYSEMLKQLIVWNDLKRYDNYKIDYKYIVDKSCICYLTKSIIDKISNNE